MSKIEETRSWRERNKCHKECSKSFFGFFPLTLGRQLSIFLPPLPRMSEIVSDWLKSKRIWVETLRYSSIRSSIIVSGALIHYECVKRKDLVSKKFQ